MKPGRLFCPYFRSDSWSTESLNRNVTTWCDATVSRRPRIHHRDHWRAYSLCRIRYECLKIAEHELTMCHDGITKDFSQQSHRKLKMEMSVYSRSTTVIHHDSPWLIRHDTLSVRVRQSSGNRSGSGINVCTPMLSVVNPGSS